MNEHLFNYISTYKSIEDVLILIAQDLSQHFDSLGFRLKLKTEKIFSIGADFKGTITKVEIM